LAGIEWPGDARLLTSLHDSEDAAVVRFPAGKALVQTLDFFTPIVNDPFRFGQIAAANSLSDVYAMGGVPYTAMNIICYPIKKLPKSALREILRGGLSKVVEAGAVMAGGHSVEDKEIKFGLSVTGAVDPDRFSSNRGLVPGDTLILTKPLGTGVLATAIKTRIGDKAANENMLWECASRLNKGGGRVIAELGLRGATDVTGFGLAGHTLEMARASGMVVEIFLSAIPPLGPVLDLIRGGRVPGVGVNNRNYCASQIEIAPDAEAALVDLTFDPQTSGGLILSVPQDKVEAAVTLLKETGDLAAIVGRVAGEHPKGQGHGKLRLLA
jgi:selenide, water dikinase